jgi:hypothetical protein
MRRVEARGGVFQGFSASSRWGGGEATGSLPPVRYAFEPGMPAAGFRAYKFFYKKRKIGVDKSKNFLL